MTTLKFTSVATLAALVFGLVAMVTPLTVSAANAPQCVFNTIVQPFNNGGTTLSWKVYDAHTIYISGIGNVTDADSIVVYPSVVTTYTLTATGNGGVDTCTVVAQPTTSYSFGNTTYTSNQMCDMWVNPDYVVPGGTAILSWNAGNASYVTINNGIGNVGSTGSRVVPNVGVAQTFTLTASWPNGTTRNCSATVYPTSTMGTPTYTPGVYNNYTNPYAYQNTPQYTYTPNYVSINQVPYTGTNDAAYVLTLLAVALGAFALLYTKRRTITSLLGSFSPADNDDFEVVIED